MQEINHNRKICLAGKSNVLVECLKYLLEIYDVDSICIISSISDPPQHNWQYSIKQYCTENHIRQCLLEDVYDLEELIFISLQFDIIINPKKFKSRYLYNIHFSFLPDYKGLYPTIWPILNGVNKTGVTIHLIDAGIDTGDIIDQEIITIDINDTSRDLYLKCQAKAVKLFKINIHSLIIGEYNQIEQSNENSRYYSKKSIDFSDSSIDFNLTAFQIHNRIRAFIFREFQLPVVFGHKICKSEITTLKRIGKPGAIIEQNHLYITISTIDYSLKLYKDYVDEFFECCIVDNFEKLKEIIPLVHDLNVTDKLGNTGLMLAAQNENLIIIKLLVEAGAYVNLKTPKDSALNLARTVAIESGRRDIVDYLTSKGLELNDKA